MRIYEYLRKKRIEELIEALNEEKKTGEEINKKKLVIGLMMKYNISRKTALEYLQVAEMGL